MQDVADPNLPEPELQQIQTTELATVLSIVVASRCRTATTTSIFGNLGRDILIGGAGHDMVDGDEEDDLSSATTSSRR